MSAPMSGPGNLNLQNAYRVVIVINVALIMSLVTYAMIVEVLKGSPRTTDAIESLGVLRAAFFAVGMVLVIAVKYLQTTLLTKTTGESPQSLIAKLQRYSVVAAALSEVPGILGLALFIIGGARTDFYILLVMSLAMFAVYFPRLSQWKDWMGSAHRVA